MSTDDTEPGHGNSPAAWTAVVIMLVAFTVGTIAFFFNVQAVVWASAGLVIVGLLAGYVLARLGYGVGGSRHVPKDHTASEDRARSESNDRARSDLKERARPDLKERARTDFNERARTDFNEH